MCRWHPVPMLSTFLVAAVLFACRESDFTGVDGPAGALAVGSDPPGATILLDGEDTGRITPDTLRDLDAGVHELTIRLDTLGDTYGYRADVQIAPDTLLALEAPLLLRCVSEDCFASETQYHERGRIRFATRAGGALLHRAGSGGGILWPVGTDNSYVSVGAAVFAGVIPDGRTFALGPYNLGEEVGYVVGRPAPQLEDDGERLSFRQSNWIVPPPNLLARATARGIAIDQQVIARSDVEDALLIRLVFRNITDKPLYRFLDRALQGGLTYEDAYIGFVLDGDVGDADDDLISYAPDLDLAFVYDSDFREPELEGGWADRPGLVGVRVLAAPADATVILNGWPRAVGQQSVDWVAGTASEPAGLAWLSGSQTVLPNHDHPRIGFAAPSPGDMRVSVSAGPLTLAPGDSAAITIAVVLAPPVEGTYASGTVLEPGDPTDAGRGLLHIAELLLERARAAEALAQAPR